MDRSCLHTMDNHDGVPYGRPITLTGLPFPPLPSYYAREFRDSHLRRQTESCSQYAPRSVAGLHCSTWRSTHSERVLADRCLTILRTTCECSLRHLHLQKLRRILSVIVVRASSPKLNLDIHQQGVNDESGSVIGRCIVTPLNIVD